MQPEEQVYFECTTQETADKAREFLKIGTISNIRFIISNIIIIVCLLYLSVSCAYSTFTYYLALFLVTYISVMVIIRFIKSKKPPLIYKQTLISNNGREARHLHQLTQSGIHHQSLDTGNKSFISYEHFVKMLESKNLIVLITNANFGYALDKRTLIGGTKEECLSFLWEHCLCMKRKKANRGTLGKVLSWILIITLVVSAVAVILNTPGLYLKERLSGTIGNYMSYQEIADSLEDLGITGADKDLIRYLDKEYGDFSNKGYYPYAETQLLLSCLGEGYYSSDYTNWAPAENGVYWFDLEAWDPSSMYANCLQGIAALSNAELQFTDIEEDYSDTNWDYSRGTAHVHFTYNGTSHTIDVQVDNDWFDPEFLNELNKIIGSEGGKRLYFTDDGGQGMLVFYRDAQWAKDFRKLTGMELYTDTNEIYY